MDPRVRGQLRMESRREKRALPDGDDPTVIRPQHGDLLTRPLNPRGTDEHRVKRRTRSVAAVTVADDPILVLGPALAKNLHVPAAWSGCFIAALGAGTVLGSFRRSKHEPTLRLAAAALAALGAGASCLIANSVTRAALVVHAGPGKAAAVMAVWAIAWAGSKPFASLIDGMLGSHIGLQWTGLCLAAPAFIPILLIVLEPRMGFWAENLRVEPLGALASKAAG